MDTYVVDDEDEVSVWGKMTLSLRSLKLFQSIVSYVLVRSKYKLVLRRNKVTIPIPTG